MLQDGPPERNMKHMLTKLIKFVVVDGSRYVNIWLIIHISLTSRFCNYKNYSMLRDVGL